MTKQSFDINKLRVAAPCSVPWETMNGDERSRHCQLCDLKVYNISEMTAAEVGNLVEKTEGRICGRLYKRADGTVLTKDCPVGLRAFYKRTARLAGAALTAIFALFSVGFGQSQSKNDKACKTAGRIVSVESRNINLVEGTITDPNCAVVPGAKVTLINEDTKREYQVTSNKKGYYRILLNAPGRYMYKVEAGVFNTYSKRLEINSNQSLQINASLEVGSGFIGVIVIIDEEISIDPKSSSNTFKITRDMMEKQPR
jgi:hypothetical protein